LVALQLVSVREAGASRAEVLRRFATEHAGTRAGTQALLLEGGALFTENKFAEARSCFEQFLGKAADSPLAVQASFGVASSLEAEGKASEALLKYEALARLTRESLADSAKLGMARIQVAQGKPEAALKIYQQLGENPNSMAAAEARLRAEQLLQKFPNLAPANAPAKATVETPVPLPQAK
jgi:predicted negative regulator of RcsB-dependent stress response